MLCWHIQKHLPTQSMPPFVLFCISQSPILCELQPRTSCNFIKAVVKARCNWRVCSLGSVFFLVLVAPLAKMQELEIRM